MCDIQGPKIRVGKMEKPFTLRIGQKTRVTTESVVGTPERFQIRYKTLIKDLRENDLIFVNDGLVRLKVISKEEKDLLCVVEAEGEISDNKVKHFIFLLLFDECQSLFFDGWN